MDNQYNVLVVSPPSLQVQLILGEINSIEGVDATQSTLEELPQTQVDLHSELILLDFGTTENKEIYDSIGQDGLPYGILVHSVPSDSLSYDFIKWPCLKGFLHVDSPADHLKQSIRHIQNGGMWFPRHCLEQLLTYFRSPGVTGWQIYSDLTSREKQILDKIAHGESNKEIANELFLAVSTVKTHIYKLFKKLNVNCRDEAVKQLKLADRINRHYH